MRSSNCHPNSVTNTSLSSPAQHSLCPLSPPNLMPTPCQLCQQCQAGTGVTKPVGVGGGAGGNPIILQASPPPHTYPLGTESPHPGLTLHRSVWLPQPPLNCLRPLGISWGKGNGCADSLPFSAAARGLQGAQAGVSSRTPSTWPGSQDSLLVSPSPQHPLPVSQTRSAALVSCGSASTRASAPPLLRTQAPRPPPQGAPRSHHVSAAL